MSSSTIDLRVFGDPESLAKAAADEFFRQVILAKDRGQGFSCALSGGFTPRLLFTRLAEQTACGLLPARFWHAVHFFWGDERDVPPDHIDSNYRLARETLFSRIDIPAQNIHRIHPESGGAFQAAAAYEAELKGHFGLREGMMPRFDMIFLGLGQDGHTASLFPGLQSVLERKSLVAAPWVDRLQSYRITLTTPVINHAACVIFLVSGSDKAKVLKQVLDDAPGREPLPAQAIRPETGRLLWMVDRAAASQLGGIQDQP